MAKIWRRGRSFRAAVLACAYVAVLAMGLTSVASPAALAAPGGTITDCSNSSGLATAVAAGGTWTFACPGNHGTILVKSALDVTVPVTLVVPADQTVAIQQGAGGNTIFLVDGGALTLTGNGNLTLEGGLAPSTGKGVSPLLYNGVSSAGTVVMTGTTVANTVVGETYAPVYNAYGSLTVTGDTFMGNHGDRGGAIYNAGTLTVTGTTFTGNRADYATSGGVLPYADEDAGGAIYNGSQGKLTVADSTFKDNVAVGTVNASDQTFTGSGGGIFNFGTATITGSTFQGNQAVWASLPDVPESTYTAAGGAIVDTGTSLLVANSTLTANSAYQGGGGLKEDNYFNSGPAVATAGHDPAPAVAVVTVTAAVYSSTFAANTTSEGGDNLSFNADGSLGPLMVNDIMVDPRPATKDYQDCSPEPISAAAGTAGNLEQGDGSCSTYRRYSFTPPDTLTVVTGPLPGWTRGNADLQTLATNPGPYPDGTHPLLPQTMALGPDSQALGLGVDSVCQGTGVGGIDERGVARPAGHCDAGAYQSLGITLHATGPVTVRGGAHDTATVSGTVYTDVYTASPAGVPGATVPLSLAPAAGGLAPLSPTTGATGDFSATYSAPPTVSDPTAPFEAVTVTASTYGLTAAATIDVLSPPVLSNLSPTSGPGGTTLTLTGLHFENNGSTAGYVSFTPSTGGTPVQVMPASASDTSATVAVPTSFAAGTTLNVAIWNPTQGLLSNALPYQVTSGGGGGGSTPPPAGGIPVSQPVPVSTCGSIALPTGSTLQASAGTSGTPTGTEPDARAASCVFAVTGPSQAQPEPVTVQYNPGALNGLPAARISLFRLRSNGMWTFLPSTVDGSADTVTADVSGPATVVALADIQVFPDVPATYWAYASINVAAAGELVDGFPPPYAGVYAPDGPLTRAQAAKMVVVDAQLLPVAGSTPFTDVRAGDWFAPYVATGYQAGLLQGMTATTFAPNAPVTREQFAVMLARALKLKGTATLTFADVGSIAPWALPAVEAVVAAGYFQGLPGNVFEPQASLTRAAAAQVMARVIAGQAPAGTS